MILPYALERTETVGTTLLPAACVAAAATAAPTIPMAPGARPQPSGRAPSCPPQPRRRCTCHHVSSSNPALTETIDAISAEDNGVAVVEELLAQLQRLAEDDLGVAAVHEVWEQITDYES
jgi:hypothetical protein